MLSTSSDTSTVLDLVCASVCCGFANQYTIKVRWGCCPLCMAPLLPWAVLECCSVLKAYLQLQSGCTLCPPVAHRCC
jgi:hypothetical protein